jgi:hypothetical protein
MYPRMLCVAELDEPVCVQKCVNTRTLASIENEKRHRRRPDFFRVQADSGLVPALLSVRKREGETKFPFDRLRIAEDQGSVGPNFRAVNDPIVITINVRAGFCEDLLYLHFFELFLDFDVKTIGYL